MTGNGDHTTHKHGDFGDGLYSLWHCFAHINGIRMTLESSDLGDLQVDFSWQPREAVEDYVRRLPEDRVGWTVG